MTQLAGNFVQVLVDGYELTGDSNQVVINDNLDMHEMSTFASAVRKFIPGKRSVQIDHSGYLNPDTASSHEALNGLNINGVVSVFLGKNADPEIRNPAFSLPIQQGQYSISPTSGKFVPFSAKFANRGATGGWGVVLTPPVEFTDTANGVNIQDSPTTSYNGGLGFLHVLTSGPDQYAISIEHWYSGAWTNLATFALNGTQIGSDFVTLPDEIRSAVRWKATRVGGTNNNTVKIAMSFIRF